MASYDMGDHLKCAICLNSYTDPVMLGCGHSFCRVCMDRALDATKESSLYTCPKCRRWFANRPLLYVNTDLSNISRAFQPNQADLPESEGSALHQRAMLMNNAARKEEMKNLFLTVFNKQEELDVRIRSVQDQARLVLEKGWNMQRNVNLMFSDIKRQFLYLRENVKSNIASEIAKRETLNSKADPSPHLQTVTENIISTSCKDIEVREIDVCDETSKYIQACIEEKIQSINAPLFLKNPIDFPLTVYPSLPTIQVSEKPSGFYWVQEIPGYDSQMCLLWSPTTISSGQHFWKVETSAMGSWRFGVSYASMNKVHFSLGYNNHSWCLSRLSFCAVAHDRKLHKVDTDHFSHTYAILLDYEAGKLSFYQLGDTVRHLYTYKTTFTEPLCPTFQVFAAERYHLPIDINDRDSCSWMRIRNW